MGRKSAEILADAAAQGALGNSRLVIVLTDAFEAQWRLLVDSAIEDMRGFITASNTKRVRLISAARQQMLATLPIIRTASRIEKPENGYPARILVGESLKRVEASTSYMEMRLRQFELGIGEPLKSNRIMAFFRELSWQTLVAALAALLLTAIVAIWAVLRAPQSPGSEVPVGSGYQDGDANLTPEPIQNGARESQLEPMQAGNSTNPDAQLQAGNSISPGGQSSAPTSIVTHSERTNQPKRGEASSDTEPALLPAIAPKLPAVDLLGRLCQTNTITVSFEMRPNDYHQYDVLNGSQVLRVRCNGQRNFTVIKDGYETEGTVGRNAIDFVFQSNNGGAVITCNVSAAGITGFSFVGRISCQGSILPLESRPAHIDI
jgi:hypothetical protein